MVAHAPIPTRTNGSLFCLRFWRKGSVPLYYAKWVTLGSTIFAIFGGIVSSYIPVKILQIIIASIAIYSGLQMLYKVCQTMRSNLNDLTKKKGPFFLRVETFVLILGW